MPGLDPGIHQLVRVPVKWNQRERHARSAPTPACGGGLGRGRLEMAYHVACPLPVPPPQAGEGTMWRVPTIDPPIDDSTSAETALSFIRSGWIAGSSPAMT